MKLQPKNLATLTEDRLSAYALAASAAGVSLLALAQPADARIVFHRLHHVIRPGQDYALDLNHDSFTDFTLRNLYDRTGKSGILSLTLASAWKAKEGVWASTQGYIASPLAAQVSVGPNAPFASNRSEQMAAAFSGGKSSYGPWCGARNRYLGLKFPIGSGTHFGWARLSVACKPTGVFATLTGYAYETIPNKPIITGKTKGPNVTTVPEGGLGHLAAGASVPAGRQRQR
jgi:hypothetical protein